jgi:hypothetical protein
MMAKVRNWHKRNTRAALSHPVVIAVHSQTDDRWEPYAQIMLRSEERGVLNITFTPAEFIEFRDAVNRMAEKFL